MIKKKQKSHIMNSKFNCKDSQIKKLILECFTNGFAFYKILVTNLHTLSLEAKLLRDIDGSYIFAPSDIQRVDRLLCQLFIEQKIYISFKESISGNAKFYLIENS